MSTKKNKALDWAARCAKSKGVSFIVPKEFIANGNELLEMAESMDAIKKDLMRKEADFAIKRDNYWYNLRTALEAKGAKDVFQKNINFDEDAKKDGILVVNLYDDMQGRPMGLPRK